MSSETLGTYFKVHNPFESISTVKLTDLVENKETADPLYFIYNLSIGYFVCITQNFLAQFPPLVFASLLDKKTAKECLQEAQRTDQLVRLKLSSCFYSLGFRLGSLSQAYFDHFDKALDETIKILDETADKLYDHLLLIRKEDYSPSYIQFFIQSVALYSIFFTGMLLRPISFGLALSGLECSSKSLHALFCKLHSREIDSISNLSKVSPIEILKKPEFFVSITTKTEEAARFILTRLKDSRPVEDDLTLKPEAYYKKHSVLLTESIRNLVSKIYMIGLSPLFLRSEPLI